MPVIRCQRSHFEARCLARGYSVKEAVACIVSVDGDVLTVEKDHPAFPGEPRPGCPGYAQPPMGLGDIVAAGLSAIGITKERVSRVLGKPCGCEERQAALNAFGKRLGFGVDPHTGSAKSA